MAQSRRLGGAIFRSVSSLFNGGQAHSALPSTYVLARGFATCKLFVGGLSFRTEEESLRAAFAPYGEVSDVRIITDRETGRSRGFGFVTFLVDTEGEAALRKMDGHILDGRVIRVDLATSRAPANRTLSSGGFGSGFSQGGFNSSPGSGFSQGPGLSGFGDSGSSPPPEEEKWPEIPPANANVPQNTSSSFDFGLPDVGNKSSAGGFGQTDSSLPIASSTPSNAGGFDFGLPDVGNKPLGGGGFGQADSGPSKDGPSTLASSGFDFSFPSLENSSFQSEPRLPRRRPRPRPRPIPRSSVSGFDFSFPSDDNKGPLGVFGNTDSNSSESTAGQTTQSGPAFDFGLPDIGNKPPLGASGPRPQGGFDFGLPEDSSKPAQAGSDSSVSQGGGPPRPLGSSGFPPFHGLSQVAPVVEGTHETPEADDWSDIGPDTSAYSRLPLPNLYTPLRSFVSKDKELHWDPLELDDDTKNSEAQVSSASG